MKTIKVKYARWNVDKTEIRAVGMENERIHLKDIRVVTTRTTGTLKLWGDLRIETMEIDYETTPTTNEQIVWPDLRGDASGD